MIKDKIRWVDIKSLLIIGICYIPAFIYRLFNRNIWLCSERKDEARDNGYWMFKYIKENHPTQRCFYVINKNATDRNKIEKYKTLINWGSLKHYFIFIATRVRLSAHVDADTPNSRVTNFLDRHHLLRNKRVFLNHGIIKDELSFVYYDVTKASLMTTTTKEEYDYCKKIYGYPKNNIKLLGLARYDGLVNILEKKQILIMPTWRSWLYNVDNETFKKDPYYSSYYSLLNNKKLIKLLDDNNIYVVFFLHSEMMKFSHLFKSESNRIKVINSFNADVQNLINTSSLMITDYSSVAFDMAFLRKPVIYYHFDYNHYREQQHATGYFSYQNDGFGPVSHSEDELIKNVEDLISKGFLMDTKYLNRAKSFFTFSDRKNCERIFNAVCKL